VQSALAAALPVSAITQADPGVATYTGTDPANGDYLYASDILGMHQLDDRIIRAANVNAASNTVELEGEDTAAYDAFTSGNLQVVTFGTSLRIIADLTVSGGDFDMIDTTTIHDLVKTQIPGAASPIEFSGTCMWDVADAGFDALKRASAIKAKRAWRFTFTNGQIMLFTGYIGFTGAPTGSAQDKVVTPFKVTMFGRPTYYAA
jgi:hypothetical protein